MQEMRGDETSQWNLHPSFAMHLHFISLLNRFFQVLNSPSDGERSTRPEQAIQTSDRFVGCERFEIVLLTAQFSDEEDEDMQGVYPGQEVKPAPSINIDVHLKIAIEAALHNQPLLVAIGWVGRHFVSLLDNADVSAVNEVVADGQTVRVM